MKWPLTEGAKRALKQAAVIARLEDSRHVEPLHLLWALVLDESQAADVLAGYGITRASIAGELPVWHDDPELTVSGRVRREEVAAVDCSLTLQTVLWEAGARLGRLAETGELNSELLLWALTVVSSPAAVYLQEHGVDREALSPHQTEVGEPLEVDFEIDWSAGEEPGEPDASASGFTPSTGELTPPARPGSAEAPSEYGERTAEGKRLRATDKRQKTKDDGSPGFPASISASTCFSVVWRMLDAAANRAREALRVIEDFTRFALSDAHLSRALKECRHALAQALNGLDGHALLMARNTPGDVGTQITTEAESVRETPLDVIRASFKRAQEALRSLEEYGKTVSAEAGRQCEAIRYRLYTLESAVLRTAVNREWLTDCRLYLLLTQSLCTRPAEEVLRESVAAGVDVVQIREKAMSDRQLLDWCRRMREIIDEESCQRHAELGKPHHIRNGSGSQSTPVPSPVANAPGSPEIRTGAPSDGIRRDAARRLWAHSAAATCRPLLIVNDRPDIAVLCHADGVHLGQDELSVAEARRIVGVEKFIGVSTHNIKQARQAVLDGADYLGIGPVFPSQTKTFDELAGLEFVRQTAEEISLPWFAIGGVTPENVSDVTAAGATRMAASGAICGATDVQQAVSLLREQLDGGGAP